MSVPQEYVDHVTITVTRLDERRFKVRVRREGQATATRVIELDVDGSFQVSLSEYETQLIETKP